MTTADTQVRDMLAERPDLLADTAQRALRYLAGLDSRRVAPAPADVAGLDRLDFPLPAAAGPPRTCWPCSTTPPRRPPWPAAGRATSAS